MDGRRSCDQYVILVKSNIDLNNGELFDYVSPPRIGKVRIRTEHNAVNMRPNKMTVREST